MGTDDIKCRIMEEELKEFWPEWHVVRRLGGGSYGDVFQIYKDNYGIRVYAALKVIQINNNLAEVTVPQSNAAAIHNDSALNGWQQNNTSNGKYRENDIPEVFTNEIRIMEALRGAPNIVVIDDFSFRKGAYTSTLYVRMELLTSFEEVMITRHKNNTPFTIAEVLKVGRDVCTALMYCEQRGIIHRDIKPANLFVDAFGNYKVGDFGVSKRMETVHASHTMTGIGTISYMAPEIFAGQSYNNTVDIYALGMVLYQLLNNGRVPFLPAYGAYTAQDFDNANYRRLRGEEVPPLTGVQAGGEIIDAQLNGIVCKACKADSHGRFRTAKELNDALTAYLVSKKGVGYTNAQAQHGAYAAANHQTPYSENAKTETNYIVYENRTANRIKQKQNNNGKYIAIIAAMAVLLCSAVGYILYAGVIEKKQSTEAVAVEQDFDTNTVDQESASEPSKDAEDINSAARTIDINVFENTNGIVLIDNVMIRDGASADAGIIGSLNKGDEVGLIKEVSSGEVYSWYYIMLGNGIKGYVRSDLIDMDNGQNIEANNSEGTEKAEADQQMTGSNSSKAQSSETQTSETSPGETKSEDYADSHASFYGIWCGAAKDKESAEKIASSLRDKGLPSNVFITTEWSNLNSEKWYVVSAGTYDSKEEAESILSQVKSYYPKAYVKYSGEWIG